jgi:hypothetical protein
MRKNYISSNENKLLSKRYNFTLSIISDHLIIGYPDTVDPFTFKPLFNCTCISAESDGYLISNRSIKLINEDSKVILGLKHFCLMKIENNINRLQKFKKEVVSKIRKNEIPSNVNTSGNQTTSFDLKKNKEKSSKKKDNNTRNEVVRSLSENKNKKFVLDRNQISKKKNRSNNKKPLSLKLNSNVLENTLSRLINEEIKNYDKKKISNQNLNKKSKNNYSRIQAIRKLKESILEKQRRIQFKKEQYLNEVYNKSNKNLKSEKILRNNLPLSININSIKNENKKNKNYGTDSFNNEIENKKNDYFNIIPPNKIIKNNFFIKDKFNELNDIVKNIHKTTEEILNNKEQN